MKRLIPNKSNILVILIIFFIAQNCMAQGNIEKVNMGGPSPEELDARSRSFVGLGIVALFFIISAVIPFPEAEIDISSNDLLAGVDKLNTDKPLSLRLKDSLLFGKFERVIDDSIIIKQFNNVESGFNKLDVRNIMDLESASKQKLMFRVKGAIFLFGASMGGIFMLTGVMDKGSEAIAGGLLATLSLGGGILVTTLKTEEEKQWDLLNQTSEKKDESLLNDIHLNFGLMRLNKICNPNPNFLSEITPCLTLKIGLGF